MKHPVFLPARHHFSHRCMRLCCPLSCLERRGLHRLPSSFTPSPRNRKSDPARHTSIRWPKHPPTHDKFATPSRRDGPHRHMVLLMLRDRDESTLAGETILYTRLPVMRPCIAPALARCWCLYRVLKRKVNPTTAHMSYEKYDALILQRPP